MMKKILCLAMTMLMVIGTPLTANAAENEKSWTVRYNGESNLITELENGQETLSLDFGNVKPGESISLEAKIKNDTSKKTDWYLSNVVTKAFEAIQSAKGGAYTYVLTYHGPNNADAVALYNSSEVGGDKSASEEAGLKEIVLHENDEYIYLDRLNPGEEAYVRLYVKLNGETVIDTYQGLDAALNLEFAVEKINEGTIIKEITKINKETITTSTPVQIIRTGDNAQLALFSSVALISGVALVVVAFRMMKRRNEKGEV